MRRALLFLLLLGLGFLALRLALGDEPIATDAPGRPRPRDDRPASDGEPIRLQQGALAVAVEVRGAFRIGSTRSVPSGDGVRFERVYELECQDCSPADRGRHRLERIRVQLFDRDVHTADLVADEALVELRQDASGHRSLREDKDIELIGAVLESVPGSRLGPVRIELGRVHARLDGESLALHTPDADQQVTVVVGGERPGTLRGRGLRARLPTDRAAELGRLDLTIVREPVVTTDELQIRASGSLHYVELLATGGGLLTVDRDVHVDIGAPTTPAAERVAVAGSGLHCWLGRDREPAEAGGRSSLAWQLLRVVGSRARVAGADAVLESPRITVAPGPTGQPYVITADGGQADLLHRGPGGEVSFRSSRPVHLLRPQEWLGAVHRRFGFPDFALGALRDLQVVVFAGAARLDAGDGVEVEASRGLRLYRLQPRDPRGPLVAFGLGAVQVAQGTGEARTVARGDHGFELRRTPAGDSLVLGAADPASPQQFALSHGGLGIGGTGACRLLRHADGRVEVHLRSTAPSIAGAFGRPTEPSGGELQGARELDLELRGREILALAAEGPSLRIEARADGQHVTAAARRIEQFAPDAWRLAGTAAAPALLERPATADEPAGQLSAAAIDVFRLAPRSLLLDARAGEDARAVLRTGPPPPGARPGRLELSAQRIRVLPFAVGPAALLRAATGLPPGLCQAVTGTIGRPWLLATGSVVADVRGLEQGELHGEGAKLAASLGARAGLLVGDALGRTPAVLREDRGAGRTVATAGAGIRLFGAEGDRSTVLTHYPGHPDTAPLSPVVTFRDPAAGADDPFANLRAVCRGEIDVLPERVAFRGPVTARGLTAAGEPDPDGIDVSTAGLTLLRDADSRTNGITRAEARGGVAAAWARHRFRARSESLELDLRRERCIADDPDDVVLHLGGWVYEARHIEVNYVTCRLSGFQGRLRRDTGPIGRR